MPEDFLNSNFGTGLIGVVGTLLGALLGLFGERWVRRIGRVLCETAWKVQSSEGGVDGPRVTERRLAVTFLNRKDVDVNVWEMSVEFFREGNRPL